MRVTSLRETTTYGMMLVGWRAFVVIVTRSRFLHKADEFLWGIREVLRRG